MFETEIRNDKGEKVFLTDRELRVANHNQQIVNALGYEIPITTLTAISKSITEQKFYQIPVADFLPVRVGEGAWSQEILTYRSYATAGDFETGVVNTSDGNSRLAAADAGIDSLTIAVNNWAKEISWTIFQLQIAAKSGNWDVVTEKERSRKKNWDLGVQRTAFLGLASNTSVYGLLTQPNVSSNTALITQYISTMNATQLQAFVAGVIGAYQTNNGFTAMPTHFVIPQIDFNGLAALTPGTVGTYPVPIYDYLLNAFKMITMNPNFKILPLAYADEVNNTGVTGLGKNRYTLFNYDADSIRMDIPVDYTNTMMNSINNFQYQNVGYGQFTGVLAYRPLEVLYFDFT